MPGGLLRAQSEPETLQTDGAASPGETNYFLLCST